MQNILSETALLQQYNSFPQELQLAVSSYIEFLAVKFNEKIEKKSKKNNEREFGIGKGIIKYMADDFDAPLEELSDKMF